MTDAIPCVVDGCESLRCNSRGWCWKHYTRWRRETPVVRPETLYERLDAGIDRSGGPTACWPWMGANSTHGYGSLAQGGVTYRTHRLSLSRKLGRDLSAEEQACHHCDNPPCCNPAHLFVGSARDNSRDMLRKGRQPQRYGWVSMDDIRWLYERRVSPDRIAEEFGVSSIVIRHRIREMELPSRRAGRPTTEQIRQADAALAEFREAHRRPLWAREQGLSASRLGGVA